MLETCEKETAIMNKCSCAKPNAEGWHTGADIETTFGTLKQAQNEAAQETAEYIAHIYFTKSEKIFNELMEFIADGKFTGSYSRVCEWQANYNSPEFQRIGDNWECCEQVAVWHDCDKQHAECFTLVCEYCGNFDRDCEDRPKHG